MNFCLVLFDLAKFLSILIIFGDIWQLLIMSHCRIAMKKGTIIFPPLAEKFFKAFGKKKDKGGIFFPCV